MQEEPDTCRICSAPAEPDQPLFYPCKCSGTIRYTHQDCLTEWLAHSKKKTCDVCKYPYSFTKVYSKDMPERLPILLIMRQFSHQLVSTLLFGLRATLVATVWLAALPWATIWTWRMYFAVGNSAAWWISALNRPTSDVDFYTHPTVKIMAGNATTGNATSSQTTVTTQDPVSTSIFQHPIYKAVTSDIFAGQIIASIIILTFVAIFLLREWITQNARPGVFEDGDVPADAAEPDVLPPLPELPPPPINVEPPPLPVIAEPAHYRAAPGHVGRDESAPEARAKKPRTKGEGDRRSSEEIQGPGPSRVAKGKRRAHTSARDERKASESYRLRRLQRMPDPEDESAGPDPMRRLTDVARQGEDDEEPNRFVGVDDEGSRRHSRSKPSEKWPSERSRTRFRPHSELPALSEFTFRAPGPAYPSSSKSTAESPPTVQSLDPYQANGYGESPPNNPFALFPPLLDSDSDEDDGDRTPTRPSTPVSGASVSILDLNRPLTNPVSPSPTSSTPLGLRRPPLPTITLPPSPVPPSSVTHGHSPLASPSLATYRAPEDLATEPSLDDGYFRISTQAHDTTNLNTMEERRRYFRDQEADEEEEEYRAADDWERIAGEDEPGRTAFEDEGQVVEDIDIEDANLADGEMDEEGDEVQWTDEEGLHEDEEDDEGVEGGGGIMQVGAEDAVGRLDGGAGAAGGVPLPELRVMGQPPELPLEDLDPEVNVEDDMDGALEAIGLRGPLVGVLQNAVLMTFILDTTIGLGIWLPFTIGKSTALLTLNPRRAVQLLHLPLRMIRLVTDPVVDTALYLLSRLLLPLLARLGQTVLKSGLQGAASMAGQARTDKFSEFSVAAIGRVLEAANHVFERATTTLSVYDPPESQPITSKMYRILKEDTTIMRIAEPYFAPMGKNVRELSEEGKTTWIRFATGDNPNDRLFAVVLGYAVVGLLLAIYLNVLTVGSMRSAGRAVRSAVRQQLLVVKVAAFIVIELVIFPLGCGVMLDVCTVWLFPQGSFRSRAAFLMYAPLTAVFYHWVLGTMFMYQFAVLLSGCRSIMRAGAMWFIKDPQDQNFHPIRDILERPTLVQIRKLILSAMMYGFVVASGVATVSSILRVFSRTIMPFRWKIREPLSEVPIDLILLQLLLPYTLDSFKPRNALRRFGLFLWKYLASRLRLSSYMFGGRYPSEEFTPKKWSWRSLLWWEDALQTDDAKTNQDGSFRRVPNRDNVALVKDVPATAEVLEDGTPIDERAKRLIDAQNAEAQKAKRLVKDDYTVVYVPPQLRYRIITFLLCLWTIGSIMLASLLAAPILLGRGLFGLFVSHDVHDGYSFIAGFYLLWGCWLVGNALDRMDRRRQRRWFDSEPRAEWWLYVVKRSLLWTAQAVYMMVTVGIIIPTLVGLAFELYIMQPLRHTANPMLEPRIRVVDMWALGLLYTKIVIRSLRTNPPRHDLIRGVDRMLRNGWTHVDAIRASKEVIGPVIGGLLGMIVLPAAVLWIITRVVTLPLDGDFLFMHVYPGLFTAAGLAHAGYALSKATMSWSQTIRDTEFLVEMRLRNLEPEHEKKAEESMDQKGEPTEVED